MDRKRNSRSAQPKTQAQRLSLVSRPDFVDSFYGYTENIASPALFRKWAAISAVSGALQRRVWVRTMGSPLFPNTYIILVAIPGVGKSEVTWRVRKLIADISDEHHVASSSVTKASLMDELAEAKCRIITHQPLNPVESYNSISLVTNELGVLLPAYENEFMNVLTDLWDCKDYSESRRTNKKGEIKLDKVQFGMLAATTPSFLQSILPEGAWDQGFISRTMLIYSGEIKKRSLFADYSTDEEEWDFQQEQLRIIGNLYGEMKFTEGAASLIDHFHLEGGESTKPKHPKLQSYIVRRTVHLLKLCMIASASRSDELIIREEDYQRAAGWLSEAELHMPEIFKAMITGGTAAVIEEAWYHVFTLHAKTGEPVPEHRIIQFLQERLPVHAIKPTLEIMENGKRVEKRLSSIGNVYVPLGRRGADA